MPADPFDQLHTHPNKLPATPATDGAALPADDPTNRTEDIDGATIQLPSVAGMRYEPIRFHARGGLGEVYIANDSELHRAVALKCLRPAAGNDPVARHRFLREAAITGRLEHPGIVPIYGLLCSDRGQPFYAMRFIEGETLHSAIRRYHDPALRSTRRDIDLRSLVQRFVSVCNTMAYAHSRGIVHRDLKPQNIMLGPFGEVLVVDWGLARAAGGPADHDSGPVDDAAPGLDSGDVTQAGSIVGTPAYMSPEQADGATDDLRPPSDIFSLGAILYALIAGRPPYQGASALEVLDRARQARFDPPRAFDAAAPAALEAIALRAMAAKPEHRYPSAVALGADVERWLADEPVGAYVEPASVRLRRWMRRHRTLVSGAASLLATAAIGLAIGVVALRSEQQRTESRRQEAEAARLQAGASAEKAAEHRAMALQTLQSVIFDMQREMKERPGQQRLRQTLLLTAQRGLDQLARSVESSDEADRTKAAALIQLGDVYVQYADIGGLAAARTQFERALEIRRRIAAASPDESAAQLDLVQCLIRLGDVSLPLGQSDRAEQYFRESHAIAKSVAQTKPGDAAAESEWADSEQRVGDIEQIHGHNLEAQAAYLESNRLCRELAGMYPTDTGRQIALAKSYERLARVRFVAGRETDAIADYERQLEILLRLPQAEAAATGMRLAVAAAHKDIGNCYRVLGQVDRAVERFRTAAALLEPLERDDPDNVQVRSTLAMTLYLLGYSEWLLGRLDSANRATDGARERYRQLSEADPRNVTYRASGARAVVSRINILLQRGQIDEGLDLARRTVAEHKALSAADPGQINLRVEVVNSLLTLAITTMFAGRLDEARSAVDEGLSIARSLQKAGTISSNRFAESTVTLLECKSAQLSGDPAAIVAAAERLAATPGTGWLAPFHAACALGWADGAIRKGRPIAQLDSREQAEIDRLGRRAAELLRQSARFGMRSADVFRRMADLESFRTRPDVRILIEQLPETISPPH